MVGIFLVLSRGVIMHDERWSAAKGRKSLAVSVIAKA
jgi:hypothetical protein